MNLGVIIGLILICLGILTFLGIFFDKLPPANAIGLLSFALVIGGLFVTIIASAYASASSTPHNTKDKGYEHVCAICGKEAFFAESVINSKSYDWYCREHWQDVKKYYGY
ncbi:MAG: hypothetical protein K2N41_04010 [Lachnospiraceae bacterium]|nr:hypothetical protein [Lachnospiraceae bacterium]MDE7238859.1 hypothetical protein [Lachnospiraceae bacterium]